MKELLSKSTEQEITSPITEMENMLTSKLEGMSDEEIKNVIATGYKLLDRRKRQHEKMIKEQIKKMAIEAGIKVSFANKPKSKSG